MGGGDPQLERCPLPLKGSASFGQENRVKGYFDVTCSGKETDYCRFVTSPGYESPWLSCISPHNNCQEFPLKRSIFGRKEEDLPTTITETSAGETALAKKRSSLKDWFANECQLNKRCPSSSLLPETADSNAPGSGGHPGYTRGFFNASCRSDGAKNDYCRFVGEPRDINDTDEEYLAKSKRLWLSCVSPKSPSMIKADGTNTPEGCNNKYPGREEKFGWSLSDIDNVAAKTEFKVDNRGLPVDEGEDAIAGEAEKGLHSFFEDICSRIPCQDNLALRDNCASLNANQVLKETCEQSVMNDPDGGYRQCILDKTESDTGTCKPADNKCNMISS